MGFATVVMKSVLVGLVVIASLQVSAMGGVVYKVGDSEGWSNNGKVDYKEWAATKTFHVGDTVVFEYDKDQYDVMQVHYNDYKKCTIPSAPLMSYHSGNDSITLRKGHFFYICTKPGNCEAGQKVDIRVADSQTPTPTPIPTPTPTPAPTPSPSEDSRADHKSNAAMASKSFVGLIGVVVLVGFGWLGV